MSSASWSEITKKKLFGTILHTSCFQCNMLCHQFPSKLLIISPLHHCPIQCLQSLFPPAISCTISHHTIAPCNVSSCQLPNNVLHNFLPNCCPLQCLMLPFLPAMSHTISSCTIAPINISHNFFPQCFPPMYHVAICPCNICCSLRHLPLQGTASTCQFAFFTCNESSPPTMSSMDISIYLVSLYFAMSPSSMPPCKNPPCNSIILMNHVI